MKAILDEGVPRKLVPELRARGCDVVPFPNDWKGLKNGALLASMQRSGFDCLITCDKNMEWQNPVTAKGTALVVLPSQKLADLLLILDRIARAIKDAQPGRATRVADDRHAGTG